MITKLPKAMVVLVAVAALGLTACAPAVPVVTPTAPATPTATGKASADATGAVSQETTFAVIGDYGMKNSHEAAVARLVAKWKPAYIIATGDDYYRPAGGTGSKRYDRSTGAYYCKWLADVTTTGTKCPAGKAEVNAFFPALGNHDYSDAKPGPSTYLRYFRLPGAGLVNSSGNERYYDYVQGPVHFFVLNSNSQEPDGTSSTSRQAAWLKAQLAKSTSAWNVVYDHHPPYSSDRDHGSTKKMRWPFAKWGADVVLSGHSHTYERVLRGGVVYFVNGLGGAARYSFGKKLRGSAVRYAANWGAQKVTVTETKLRFDFYSVSGKRIDSYTLKR